MANITGTNGNDTLIGTEDADTIRGLRGNDTLEGLAGADQLDGGPGQDTVTYRSSPSIVSVNLSAGEAGDGFPIDGFIISDTLVGIEHLEGSSAAISGVGDALVGDDSENHIRGLDGNDNIVGSGGNDRLDGGNGQDIASYPDSPAGISASLITGRVRDGFGTADTLVSIEDLRGSNFNDRLTGNDGVNLLLGQAGDDAIAGRGGDDFMDGGNGNDRLDGGAGNDGLNGRSGDDTITGRGGDDFVIGGDGDDRLDGGAGDDRLLGEAEVDTVEAGDDLLIGGDGDDRLDGREGNDTERGGDGADTFQTSPGDDLLDGGRGSDTLQHSGGPLSVDLAAGTVSGGFIGTDQIVSIENVVGGNSADTLSGNDRANIMTGSRGNDTVDGGVDQARDVFIYNFDPRSSEPFSTDGSDTIRNLDAGEDVLRLVSGLTDPRAVDRLITVQDDGADTTLRFVDSGDTITLVGVTEEEEGFFNSVSELVEEGIVVLV